MPKSLKQLYMEEHGTEAKSQYQPSYINPENIDPVNYVQPLNLQQKYQLEKEQKKNQIGFTEFLGKSIETDTMLGAAAQFRERNDRDFVEDPEFKVDDKLPELVGQYSDREIEYLRRAKSESDFAALQKDIEHDREREQKMATYGGAGLATRMAVSVLDPMNIIIGAATGGYTQVSGATRLVRALKIGALSAAENTLMDAVILQSDTQRDWDDLFLSAAAGFVAGGGIAALKRNKPIAKAVEGIDEDIAHAATAASESKVRTQIARAKRAMLSDTSRVADAISEHTADLTLAAGKSTGLTRMAKKLASKQARLTREIEELKKGKATAIEDFWSGMEDLAVKAKRGAAGTLKGIANDSRIDRIAAKHNSLIMEREIALDKINKRLVETEKAVNARAELTAWDAMTKEQQIRKLFPNETIPKKRAANKATKESMHKATREALEDELKETPAEKAKSSQKAGEARETADKKSIGAALTRDDKINSRFATGKPTDYDSLLDDIIDKTEAFEEAGGKSWIKGIPDYLLGDYSIITQHPCVALRGLANLILANPQTGKFGSNLATTVRLLDAEIRKAGMAAIDDGFDMFLKENNIGKVKGYIAPSYRADFEKKVALAIKGIIPADQLSEGMKRSVEGVRNQFKKALELRKLYGELGFEKIEYTPNYLPDIMSREGLSSLSYRFGWGKNDVMELIAKGYKQGGNELTEKQSRLLAFIKYNSWEKGQLYDGDVHSIFHANSLTEAKQLLEQAKVPKELIDDFVQEITEKENWATISNRARKSMHIDWNASHEVNGQKVRIADIMNTNVSQLTEAYTKESAYGAGMARHGINSEGMMNGLFLQVRKQALEEAKSVEQAKKTAELFDRLRDCMTLIQGRPLVDYSKTSNRAGRMLLDLTSLLRLQQAGFASVADLARTIHQVGIIDTLRAMPDSGILRNPFDRHSKRTVQGFKNVYEDMEELEYLLGFFEEDNFHHSFTSRSLEFGSEAHTQFGRMLENSMEGMKHVGQWMNLFNTVQGSISKISARAISRRLLRDALGQGKLSKSLSKELLDTGMTEARWSEISDWVKKNSKKAQDGKNTLWNFEAMPREMRMEMAETMSKIHTRNVQRGLVGETNSKWYGPYARFITQFKSHPLISVEKQLIHDMRGDIGSMMGVTSWGIGLGYLAYSAQAQLRAMGMPEDKRDDFLDRAFSAEGLVWGVLNKHSQLASLGLLSDASVMTGAMPKAWYDSTRYGYQNSQFDSMVPALGVIDDTLALGSNLFNMAYGPLTEGGDDFETASSKAAKSALRLTPFANTVYFGEYIKNAADLK